MSKGLRMTEAEYHALLKRNPGYATTVKPLSTVNPHRVQRTSSLEVRLQQQITDANLPVPRLEHYPILDRDFRLDFAWVDRKLYVEVQGMAHRIKGKFRADIEKRALLTLAGWRGLEVGGAEIRSGKAIEWIKELLR